MRGIYLGDRLRSTSGKPELSEIMKDGVPETVNGQVRTVEFDGPEHILTIGPTRSGKGRRLLTPNLLYDTDRSIVVVDPKGELAQWTAPHRAKSNRKVVALDPFGVLANDPQLRLPSAGYNPMRWLNIDDNLVDDATAIAEAMVPVRSEREPHWEEWAQDLVAGLIIYYRLVKPPGTSLADIRAEFNRDEEGWLDLVAGDAEGITQSGELSIIAAADRWKVPELDRKLSHFVNFDAANREMLGVISSARTATRFLGSPPIAKDMAVPGIDFAEMRTKPMTVYLVLPPIRLVTHAKWLRLVISGAIEALRKAPRQDGRPDVLFMLDEFPQLGHMQTVETGVQLNAGYGIRFWIVVQNVTQLKTHYKENWETFLSAGVVTAYAPRDPTTSLELAKLSGERTIEVAGYGTAADGKQSYSISLQRRENVMPHEFRQMPKGRMFVRVPSDASGERFYITHAPDFTELPDVPSEVKKLGGAADP